MKLKGIILTVLFVSLLGCRMTEKVVPDTGLESSSTPTFALAPVPLPSPPVAITNISVEPESVPNDGGASITIRCTATPMPGAAVRRVWLDLRHTTLPEEITLDPVIGKSITNTFTGTLKIPDLLDTGCYGVPLLAEDTQGRQGTEETKFQVAYYRGQIPHVSSPEFLRSLEKSGHGRFVPHNRVEILEKGETALRRRLDLIESAQTQINLQTYTLSNSGAGKQIIDSLLEKADAGIEVNILLNHDSQIPTSPISIFKLRLNQFIHQAIRGAKPRLTEVSPPDDSPLGRLKNRPGTRGVNLLLFQGGNLRDKTPGAPLKEKRISHWLARMLDYRSRKEANDAETPEERLSSYRGPGGLPVLPLLDYASHEKLLIADGKRAIVGGRNIQDKYFTRWVDLDIYLEGPVVNVIQQAYLESFQSMAAGDGTAVFPSEIRSGRPMEGGVPVLYVRSRPWRKEYHTLEALVNTIRASTQHIFMSSQYLVLPDSLLKDAILEAASRGVDIRIITNSYLTCYEVSFGTGYFLTLSYLDELLNAGVRVYEYNGLDNEFAPQPYYHPKEFLFDGELTAIGSFNLSLRSSYIESENLVFVHDPDLTFRREADFLAKLENLTTEITLERLAELEQRHPVRIDISRFLELLY